MAPDRLRKHIVFVFAMVLSAVLLLSTRYILGSLARRQALEKTMRESEQLTASVFTNAREGIVITDTSGKILDINSTFTDITGYSRQEAIGQNPRILRSDRQGPEFYAAMWSDLISKGYWSGDIWNCRKNGELFAALLTISVVRDAAENTQHYVALFTDITDIKDHQRQIAHMAHYDSLSNLPNRILLVDRLRQAMLQCRRREHCLAVAYLDLDNFKEINDEYGTGVGDELLIAVADNMRSALRDEDTLARIGGDEFVAVLVDINDPQECYPVLKRLLEAASILNTVSVARSDGEREVQLKVSASIGFTFYPQDDVDADQLLRQADHAMYQAKQAGKNRYHLFDVVHDAALKSQTESLERIRQGLEDNEFVLYFQPKINMHSGEVVGVESLIRWQHPERGLLSPIQFLPIIENHPLSITLGEWVINTALDHMGEWAKNGLDIAVSVNVGARQLQQESFGERLAQFLAAHPSINPRQLELEILETNAMEDMAKVTANILHCRALGVGFALDDFGSGYSSLTYLKRLHVDMLKIDQSFVRDMLEDADDLAIVKSIISLAQTFHRSVIAEGVETTAHGELLMKLGCDLAQGFGIARPMPANELPQWVEHWTRNGGSSQFGSLPSS
jgi:diguanylate cyclase (GGDEF)-like protein/PAS domain S-box-containing protein